MDREKDRKYTKIILICLLLILVLTLIPVFVLGGKELSDFTRGDWQFAGVCLVLLIITFIVLFIFAVKSGKNNSGSQVDKTLPKWYKQQQRRGTVLSVLAGITVYAASLLGLVAHRGSTLPAGHIVVAAILGISLLLMGISYFGSRRLDKHFSGMTVAQQQTFLLSHREQAEKTAAEKLRLLGRIRVFCGLYALLLAGMALIIAWFAGAAYTTSSSLYYPELVLSWQLLCVACTRIRLPEPKAILEEQKGYLDPGDYPLLYELAQKAAQECGHSDPVRILIQGGGNASVFTTSGNCCLEIGADLLCYMTEEEFYTVLLHEFAHESPSNEEINRANDFDSWIHNGCTIVCGDVTSRFFLRLPYSYYDLQHVLYRYASTIGQELRADAAMAKYAAAAASALTKIQYYALFSWEDLTSETINFHAAEEPDPGYARLASERFCRILPERQAVWKELAKNEILGRSASHPTLMMRLNSLGFDEIPDAATMPTGQYLAEAEKAMDHLGDLIVSQQKENFEQVRKERYLDPLQRIADWESAGEPLIAETYGDILSDLFDVMQKQRAMALCNRAIEELPAPAACEAYFLRGIYRLHSLDKGGLDDLYFAIENNSNYIDDALSEIGSFCVLMGMQDELEDFRRRAVEIAQRQKDIYSQIGVLKKSDNLSAEQLPEGMQRALLEFIAGTAPTQIQDIYLVKKTITEDFSTSAVVLKFFPDVSAEERSDIYHRIFRYLDTSTDWQFSLFDYANLEKSVLPKLEPFCIFHKPIT